MSRHFTLLGLILIITGIIFIFFSFIARKIPLFRLPGDIAIEKEGLSPGQTGGFYFPVISCLLISIILTLVINLVIYILSKR